MAQFYNLPLSTDSYLSDTRHLTAAQHGAYLLLLMTAWRTRTNSLPNDDRRLCKWACMSLASWKKAKPVVMSFWKIENSIWRNEKLDRVRENVSTRVAQKKSAGEASALKRKESASTNVPTEGQRNSTIQNQSQNQTLSSKEDRGDFSTKKEKVYDRPAKSGKEAAERIIANLQNHSYLDAE